MADNSWKHLEEPWERVKWARARHFPSAVAAAIALGIKDGTYRCYERGPGTAKWITLEYSHAKKFAQLFKVRWEWLLDGIGEPWLTQADAEHSRGPDEDEPADEGPPNQLRIWREHRGYTVAELARRSGLSAQTITEYESDRADLPSKLLSKLADALSITQGHLLEHSPDDVDPDLWNAAKAVPKERRAQAIEILKTFRSYQRLR